MTDDGLAIIGLGYVGLPLALAFVAEWLDVDTVDSSRGRATDRGRVLRLGAGRGAGAQGC